MGFVCSPPVSDVGERCSHECNSGRMENSEWSMEYGVWRMDRTVTTSIHIALLIILCGNHHAVYVL